MMLTPQPSSRQLEWPSIIEALKPALAHSSTPVYLVGGAVRDALLQRPLHDLDFAVAGDGRRLASAIANQFDGAFYPLDPARGVGRAIIDYEGERFVIDVARFRGESLADDLNARDFTINAMAIAVDGDMQQIIDPLHGIADLSQRRLRQCAPDAISTDPIRALRAVRQSIALRLMIEVETRKAIRLYGPQFVHTSAERVRDEFMTMLGGPRPQSALRTLDALGLLTLIVPEVEAMRGVKQSPPHIYDVWEHTLNVMERLDGVLTTISPARNDDNAAESSFGMIVYMLDIYRHPLQDHLALPQPNGRTARSLLMLSALLHDCGKPATRTVDDNGRIHFYQHEIIGAELALERATALRLSNDEATRVADTVRHHMRPIHMLDTDELTRRTIYRFWRAVGNVAGLDVCILTEADYLGIYGPTMVLQDWIHHLQHVGALLDAYFNQRETVVSPPPLVTGRDLMEALSLEPGPEVGRLLSLIGEAQAAGEITTAEQALALARESAGSEAAE